MSLLNLLFGEKKKTASVANMLAEGRYDSS